MKKTSDTIDNRRRTFLTLAAVAAPAAATLAVTGTQAAAAELEAEGSGFKDTPQVLAFYESARF